MSNENMTRSEAIARGLFKYYTGVKCKRGHLGYRYTTSGTCSVCANISARKTAKIAHHSLLFKKEGLIRFSCYIDREDEYALREFVEALRIARKLSTPS